MAKDDKKEKAKVAWYRSVQTKITLTLVVVVTLILTGFGLYNLNEAQQRLDQELQDLSETTVQRLSQHVIGPFWSLNDDQIAEQLEATMLERRVFAVVLRDRDRETVYMGRQRDADWQVRELASEPTGDLVRSRTNLVRDDGEMIGVLEVYVTRQFLEEQFNELMLQEIGRGVILDIVIILVTLIMLRRLLVTPIRQLTDAADRISAGQLNTTIDVRSRDEIGLLAGAIGKLQTSLRIAIERMKRSN
jgi:methyl-accepting chemotaxis protein